MEFYEPQHVVMQKKIRLVFETTRTSCLATQIAFQGRNADPINSPIDI